MPKHAGGAPIANRNNMRHGLSAGRLPKGCAWIRRDTDTLRRVLEDEIAARNGGNVSIFEGALVNSVLRWETHAMLAQRWLRLHCDEMDHATRLQFSREIARASSERDKCLKLLGLDRSRRDRVIDVLYAHTEPQDEEQS